MFVHIGDSHLACMDLTLMGVNFSVKVWHV